MVRTYRYLLDDTVVQVRADREKTAPYGLNGGLASSTTKVTVTKGGETKSMPGKFLENLSTSDTLRIEWPGAGGWGDPLEREPQTVLDGRDSGEGESGEGPGMSTAWSSTWSTARWIGRRPSSCGPREPDDTSLSPKQDAFFIFFLSLRERTEVRVVSISAFLAVAPHPALSPAGRGRSARRTVTHAGPCLKTSASGSMLAGRSRTWCSSDRMVSRYRKRPSPHRRTSVLRSSEACSTC